MSFESACEAWLAGLAVELQLDAAVYEQLLPAVTVSDRRILLRLSREKRNTADCLLGIRRLRDGLEQKVTTPTPEIGLPLNQFRWCVGRMIRRIRQYENHRQDEEYGLIFGWLAQREEEDCASLLAIVGRMPS